MSARARTRGDIDRDRKVGGHVAHGVDAAAALQRVGTDAADQRVVARSAIQQIVVGIARQQVRIRRTDDILDIRVGIAGRVAAGCGAGEEVDRHCAAGCRIVEGVLADSTIEAVSPRPTDQDVVSACSQQGVRGTAARQGVVAAAAIEQVGIGIARQVVCRSRPDDIEDSEQAVAFSIAPCAGAGRNIDRDREAGDAVVGRIGPATTNKRVRTKAAHQRVGATATVQNVVVAVAGELVGSTRANHVDEVDEGVALGVRTGCRAGAEVDRDAARR